MDAESFYHYGTGDVFEIFESGGGGYGDPRKRDIDKVRDDVQNGLVSIEQARNNYAVVIDPATHAVDTEATNKLRSNP